jgi:hypothetical protein
MEDRLKQTENTIIEMGKVLAVTVDQTSRNTDAVKELISTLSKDREILTTSMQELQTQRALCAKSLEMVDKRLVKLEDSQRWLVRGFLSSIGMLLVSIVALVVKLTIEGRM